MSVRTALKLIYILVGLMILIGAAILIIGVGVYGGEPGDYNTLIFQIAFVTPGILAALIAIIFLRCPRCKKTMTREEYRSMECSACGEKF
jgi:hypothetical protein